MDVGDGVFGCGAYLLDACRGDQAVEALVLGGDLKGQGIELVGVAHVAFCGDWERAVLLVPILGIWGVSDIFIRFLSVRTGFSEGRPGKGKRKEEISRWTYACNGGNRRSRDLPEGGRLQILHLGCPGGRGSGLG